MREIEDVLAQPTNYEILRASALLRQLLVDGNRLVDQVNRETRIKLEFVVVDAWESEFTKTVLSLEPKLLAVLDGLSPETSIRNIPTKQCSRDQFLSFAVIFVNEKYLTVRDVIDHCANVMGGVHLGAPKTESQKELSGIDYIEFGGAHVSIWQLQSILRIVQDALRPLKKVVCQ